jgi:hypothetical protein
MAADLLLILDFRGVVIVAESVGGDMCFVFMLFIKSLDFLRSGDL